MKGLFVTGTDTDVGKTWISCLIARELAAGGHRVGVYKPACSGSCDDGEGEYWPDLRALAASLSPDVPLDRICPQRFKEPLAPPVAAAQAGRSVDARLLRDGVAWWTNECDVLIIEGVGGLLCPLTDDETIADFAADLGFPLLTVARPNLGTINHTLLTLEACRTRALSIAGVVLNNSRDQAVDAQFVCSNAQQIESFDATRVLGYCVFNGSEVLTIGSADSANVDWFSLASRAE